MVEGVFFGRDFISVTAAPGVSWTRPRAAGARDPARPFRQRSAAVRARHGAGIHIADEPRLEEDPADADIIDQIKELIETRVRPAVAQDGGDIVYKGYRGRTALSVDARRLFGLPVVDRHVEARDRGPDPPLRSRSGIGRSHLGFDGVAASRRMCPLFAPCSWRSTPRPQPAPPLCSTGPALASARATK